MIAVAIYFLGLGSFEDSRDLIRTALYDCCIAVKAESELGSVCGTTFVLKQNKGMMRMSGGLCACEGFVSSDEARNILPLGVFEL